MLENFVYLEKSGAVHPRPLNVNMRVLLNADDNEFSEYYRRCVDGKLIIDESLGKFRFEFPTNFCSRAH